MNPTEQKPAGSQQHQSGQSSTSQSTTGGQYNQARQFTGSSHGEGTSYGEGSQYNQGSQYGRYSGRNWQDDSSWMSGKVGLYSALAAGSIGALTYLLINRDTRSKASDVVSHGVDTLQHHAKRVSDAFSGMTSGSRYEDDKSDWENLQSRDVMTDAPAVVTSDTRLDKVAAIMEDCDCGAIPVVDNKSNRKPIGIVTDRDIVIRGLAEGRNPLEMTARDVMTTDIVSVKPDASLEDVAEKMRDHQVRRVIVVDRNSRCRGIISQGDLARYAPKREVGKTVREVSERSGGGFFSRLTK
jgi:CBS domain-containing protein